MPKNGIFIHAVDRLASLVFQVLVRRKKGVADNNDQSLAESPHHDQFIAGKILRDDEPGRVVANHAPGCKETHVGHVGFAIEEGCSEKTQGRRFPA